MNTRSIPSRILLADDNPTILRLVTTILLEHPRFKIVGEAHDGVEAVAQADNLKPDVVVLNINMPRMSGLEAGRIRKQHPLCSVVILSANQDERFIEEARKAGANGFVGKSDAVRDLVRTIDSAKENHELFILN